jgi:hypothetical protein
MKYMKPVRVMRDIVRPKTAPRARGARALFRAVIRSSHAKIPFFICLVAILAEAVGIAKFAPTIIPLVAPQFSDTGISPDLAVNVPQETAMAQNVVAVLSADSTSSATSSDTLPEIQPGMLPVVLRFEDPATEASIADYHLESLAPNPAVPYTYAGTDIHIPLSFTINAASQKMLPVEILGVHRLGIYGVNPTIAITLRQVTIDKTQNKVVLDAAKISWSCIVPLGAYDPNATSGPACLQ